MEVFFCLLLLGSSAAGFFQGNGGEQDNRLYIEVETLCDQLEDFNRVVSIKKVSLAKHVTSVRLIADEIDKVHQEVTKGKVVGAGVAVSGGLITATGFALDVFIGAWPLTSLAGEAISLIGSYFKFTASSKEQKEETKNVIRANEILDLCQQDLKEISDRYLKIQERFMFLEEEKELHGTILNKKLMEIKIRFPHFLPPKIKSNDVGLKTDLVSFVINVATYSGLITSIKDKLFGSSKEMPNPATQLIKGGDLKEETALSTKVSRASSVIQVAQAAYTAASTTFFLYQNLRELYNGITHLNKGSRSEMAENMRDVASNIEEVIESLDQDLKKESK
ncbi:uncharacterized protein LOC144826888 [Lissotriton helveticus]